MGEPTLCLESNSPVSPSDLQFAIQTCNGVGCNPESIICTGGFSITAVEVIGCICVNQLGTAISGFGIIGSVCVTQGEIATGTDPQVVTVNDMTGTNTLEIIATQGSQSVYTLQVIALEISGISYASAAPSFDTAYTIDRSNAMPTCYGSVYSS